VPLAEEHRFYGWDLRLTWPETEAASTTAARVTVH
jgi:hypothetical protein